MIMVGVFAVQWVELQMLDVFLFIAAPVCLAATTPAPSESTGILGLSRDVILWIIIGTASLLVVTCVCIGILLCVIVRKKRADKRAYTPTVVPLQPVHGDAIRGIGPSQPATEPDQYDGTERTPQSSAQDSNDYKETTQTNELQAVDQR